MGFGAAAHSCFCGERYAASCDVDSYMGGVRVDESSRVALSAEDVETEYVMLALRLREGLSKQEYTKRFGVSPETKYAPRMAKYLGSGHIIDDGRSYRLSREGMLVSNHILADILDL